MTCVFSYYFGGRASFSSFGSIHIHKYSMHRINGLFGDPVKPSPFEYEFHATGSTEGSLVTCESMFLDGLRRGKL